MAKDAHLARVGIQAESAFGGAGVGDIILASGLNSFNFKANHYGRQQKINIWRQPDGNKTPGQWFEGSFSCELGLDAFLDLTLQATVTQISSSGTDPVTKTYRPTRAGSEEVPGIKIFAEYQDGPWLTFSGVKFKKIRISADPGDIIKVSLEWVAISKLQEDVDPSWPAFIAVDHLPCSPASAVIEIDSVGMTGASDFSLELNRNLSPALVDRTMTAGGWSQSGPVVITGSMVDFYQDGDFPEYALNGTEKPLRAEFYNVGGVSHKIQVDLPRIVFEQAEAEPVVGPGDTMSTSSFRAQGDAALTASEIKITTVLPP